MRAHGVAGLVPLCSGCYGRGWASGTQSAPGSAATGPAAGTYEDGF